MDKSKKEFGSNDTIIVTPSNSPVKVNNKAESLTSMRTYSSMSLLASQRTTLKAEEMEQFMKGTQKDSKKQ